MVKKILILSATVGQGHMRAAEALKTAADSMGKDLEVVILDTFRYASPLLEKLVLGTYLEMLKLTPTLYKHLYQQSEQGNLLSGLGKREFNRIVSLVVAPKLVKFFREEFQPEAIICTHPFPVGVMSYMKRKGYFAGKVYATITDFTIHSFWVFPGVDGFFIADEALREEWDAFELPGDLVWPTGIPIDPAFGELYDQSALKSQFGLATDKPVLLLTGGGMGMGQLAPAVRAISAEAPDCQFLVIAGTNEKLREQMEQLAKELSCPIRVYGYVNNIHQFMGAADLLIGKPGGMSCAEAMAMKLPVLMIDPLPGQEERNVHFLTGMGAGVEVSKEDLAMAVKRCLEDPKRLKEMTGAAARIGKPFAARDAVEKVLGN